MSEPMIKVWKLGVFGNATPVTAPAQVECEVFAYPNRDADGDIIHENSHFANEEDAWQAIIKDHKAGVALACRSVTHIRGQLTRAEAEVVRCAMQLTETEGNHRNRKRELEDT